MTILLYLCYNLSITNIREKNVPVLAVNGQDTEAYLHIYIKQIKLCKLSLTIFKFTLYKLLHRICCFDNVVK